MTRILIPALLLAAAAQAQQHAVVFEQGNRTIALEPYAPNIVRVTMSLLKEPALAGPGYGFVASPAAQGWSRERSAAGEVYRSSRLVVTLFAPQPRKPMATELDIAKFFNGSAPPTRIVIGTPDGKTLLDMQEWSMSKPNYKDGNAGVLADRRPSDPEFYQVGAVFASPADEHYYGLGQNHEGFLDHRGHTVRCWHDYTATGGPSVGIPFLVTNRGYGMIWDNPSRTTIQPGFNEQTRWTFRSRRSRVLLRHRRQHHRRDLRRLPAAHRRHAHAAESGLRLHSVQAALPLAGRGCWPWPRATASATCRPT